MPIKELYHNQEISVQKVFTAFAICAFSVSILLIYIIINGLLFSNSPNYDPPPDLFPVNNQYAEYKITKMCPASAHASEEVQILDKGFCIEYKVAKNLSNDIAFSRVNVGYSKVDLEPFVGKKVKNIKGKFVEGKEQCINDKCINLGTQFILLDIDKLELEESAK